MSDDQQPDLDVPDPPEDPALAAAVLEVESHVADGGWDQPAQLYALVETARIVAEEPSLAAAMGLDEASAEGSLTPVEQEGLPPEVRLEDALGRIAWPDTVASSSTNPAKSITAMAAPRAPGRSAAPVAGRPGSATPP